MVDVNQPLKIIENIIRENAFEQRKKENRSTVIGLRTTGPGGVAILLGPSSCRKQVNLRSCWVEVRFYLTFCILPD